MTKLPKPLSAGEEALALHLRAEGIPFEREYIFHPRRRWRFDFYVKKGNQGIAIEIEGGYGGRHQRMSGFIADTYKYNAAAKMGILVLRFTTAMAIDGTAISDVLEMLGTDPR